MYINNLSVQIYIMNWEFVLLGIGTLQVVPAEKGYCEQGDPRIRTKEPRRVSQKNQEQPGKPGATRSSIKDQYQDQLIITFA